MTDKLQYNLDLIRDSDIAKSRIIEATATILAQEIYPKIKIRTYSFQGENILGFRFNMGGNLPNEEFLSIFRQVKEVLKNVMNIHRSIYVSDYEEYSKDGEFANYFKNPAPIAETIILISQNRPELIEQSIKLVREDCFKDALASYKIFGLPEYSAPYNLYRTIDSSLKMSQKELKDLEPESGKSNEQIRLELEEKYKKYYKDRAIECFEMLQNKFPEHRDQDPEKWMVSMVAYYTLGMKLEGRFGIDVDEAEKDFSVLDINGEKTSNEMAHEVDRAVAIWNLRSIYVRINSGHFSLFSKNFINDIGDAKAYIESKLDKFQLDYTIFYNENSKNAIEAKNTFFEELSAVENKYIDSAKADALEILAYFKDNMADDPKEYISEINKNLGLVNLKYEDVSDDFSSQIKFYTKLSYARIAYGALLEGREGMDKKATSEFIRSSVKELGAEYKTLAPNSTWSSKEIEEFIISSAYVNPALGFGKSQA